MARRVNGKAVYLTFNDSPGGVFKSQVCDTILQLRELGFNIRLVAFISLRNFRAERRIIKGWLPDAAVLPMWPGLQNWERNVLLLRGFVRGRAVLARGIFAANLAAKAGAGKLVYDGRGAIAAEAEEYHVFRGVMHNTQVRDLELAALNSAHATIAVSDALVDWWQSHYASKPKVGWVIPCVCNGLTLPETSVREQTRLALGFRADEIVLVYAGSVAGWQGINQFQEMLALWFESQVKLRLLLLAPQSDATLKLQIALHGRLKQMHVAPHEVHNILSCADAALLLRPQTVTNRVASPVKFSEYLQAGLPVIISPNIGDFSAFVSRENCGWVIGEKQEFPLDSRPGESERQRINSLALDSLSRKSVGVLASYTELIHWLHQQKPAKS